MGKRGQREGSWHRRDNGLWAYRVSTPAGRKTFYGRTKAEAMAKHAAVRDLLARGQQLPDRTLVMELLGHTAVGMTARYQHVPGTVLKAATDALDRALAPDEAVP